MNLNKDDIERITENLIKQLSISVESGGFTDPNSRTIQLKLGDKVISSTHFNIKSQREYEG